MRFNFCWSRVGKFLMVSLVIPSVYAAEMNHAVHAEYNTPKIHKNLSFMPIELSLPQLETFKPAALSSNLIVDKKIPAAAKVDMSNVPILDQGPYSTCVTFAVTTVIDNLLQKGDYISQLCNLTLSSYLSRRGFFPNGWYGSTAQYLVNQIIGFGIINKTNQQKNGCAGLMMYPVYGDFYSLFEMTPEEFVRQTENVADKVAGTPLLTFAERSHWKNVSERAARLEYRIKKLLVANSSGKPNLITVAFLLPQNNCTVSACATYHEPNDTWSLVSTSQQLTSSAVAHEIIIFGYDDNAVVTDNAGVKHTGIFLLRNSWGNVAGDHGIFYMTYDFFATYVFEAEDIYSLPK